MFRQSTVRECETVHLRLRERGNNKRMKDATQTMVDRKVGTRGHQNPVPPKKTGFAEAQNRFLGKISASLMSDLLESCFCFVVCARSPVLTVTSVWAMLRFSHCPSSNPGQQQAPQVISHSRPYRLKFYLHVDKGKRCRLFNLLHSLMLNTPSAYQGMSTMSLLGGPYRDRHAPPNPCVEQRSILLIRSQSYCWC